MRDVEVLLLDPYRHRASASGHGRKQSHLVVTLNRRRRQRDVVVHGDPDRTPGRKLLCPHASPGPQPRQQRGDGADVSGQVDLLRRYAEGIPKTGKIDDPNHERAKGLQECTWILAHQTKTPDRGDRVLASLQSRWIGEA